MKVYMNFLLKSVFKKKSVYISSFLVYFVMILQIYLMPTVLKLPIRTVSSSFLSYLFIIIVLIIQVAILTSQIFRAGIDDGTEILIVSKPISRVKIVWSKLIVFLTCVLISSTISMIIPAFLFAMEYGTPNPFPYCMGLFCLSLIISLFFGAVTILACLTMKKTGASLTAVGVGCGLSVLTMINATVYTGPGVYTSQENNFSIWTINVETKDPEKLSTIATLRHLGKYIEGSKINDLLEYYKVKNPADVVPAIYDTALNHSMAKKVFYYDPVLQWLQLINLANFYQSKTNSSLEQLSPSAIFSQTTISNAYLKFKTISAEERASWSRIKLITSAPELPSVNLVPYNYEYFKLNFPENSFVLPQPKTMPFLVIPNITYDPINQVITKELSYNVYNLETMKKDEVVRQAAINKILSFIQMFNDYKTKFSQYSSMVANFKPYTFLINYYWAALNIALENMYNPVTEPAENPTPTVVDVYFDNSTMPVYVPYQFIKTKVVPGIQELLKQEIDNLPEINLEEKLNVENPLSPLKESENYFDSENRDVTFLLMSTCLSSFKTVQDVLLDSLKKPFPVDPANPDAVVPNEYNEVSSPEDIAKLSFFQSSPIYSWMLMSNLTTMNKILHQSQQPNNATNDIIIQNIVDKYRTDFINTPKAIINEEALATATIPEVNFALDLGFFLSGWIILSLLALFGSSLIYLKKDFK